MSYLSNKSYSSNSESGFTLIEVLVVLAIFVLIAGFALFVSMDSYRGFAFRSERDTIISVLQKARSQAISNVCLGTCAGNDGLKHGVHYDSLAADCSPVSAPCYIIFQGTSFSAAEVTNQKIPKNSNATITFGSDVVFNQLDAGVASAPITVNVSDTAGHSSNIVINSEGQIDTP